MKENQKPVEILTEDMTDKLPKSVQQSVVFLSKEMRPKELVPFNPVVRELLEIKELASIKYNAEDEGESIQSFKDAKAKIRSFNSKVKDTKSTIKKPYDTIGKNIIVIEKGFLSEAKEVLEILEKEFKPFLDEQQRIKDEKEAKKEAARNKEINDLKAEKEQSDLLLKRQTAYNCAKYQIIAKMKSDTIAQLNSLSKNSVKKVSEAWQTMEFSKVSNHSLLEGGFTALSDEQQSEIKADFDAAKEEIIRVYNARFVELDNIEKANLSAQREIGQVEGKAGVSVENSPVIDQPPVHEEPGQQADYIPPPPKGSSEKEVIVSISNGLEKIRLLSEKASKEFQDPNCAKLASQITGMLGQATKYINEKLDTL